MGGKEFRSASFNPASGQPQLRIVKFQNAAFSPLRNRIAFSYDNGAASEVNGSRNFDSPESPFQKFRWIRFPTQPTDGSCTYRVT